MEVLFLKVQLIELFNMFYYIGLHTPLVTVCKFPAFVHFIGAVSFPISCFILCASADFYYMTKIYVIV
jgi:hypothetical protein